MIGELHVAFVARNKKKTRAKWMLWYDAPVAEARREMDITSLVAV